jgi:hypothetical protein
MKCNGRRCFVVVVEGDARDTRRWPFVWRQASPTLYLVRLAPTLLVGNVGGDIGPFTMDPVSTGRLVCVTGVLTPNAAHGAKGEKRWERGNGAGRCSAGSGTREKRQRCEKLFKCFFFFWVKVTAQLGQIGQGKGHSFPR